MLATQSPDNTARHYLPRGFAASKALPTSRASLTVTGIETTFEQFMLQPDSVRIARRRPGEVKFEDSEQSYARRRLLDIEQSALKHKQQNAQSSASVVDKLSDALHKSVHAQTTQRLAHPAMLFSEHVGCTTTMTKLFHLLHSGTGSIAHITPLIASLPWLEQALITLVNRPMLRRKDAQGKPATVKQLRTALSFLGIDNLALLIPLLVSERIAPPSRPNFTKVREHHQSFAHANSATAVLLAKYGGQNANRVALQMMMFNVARAIIIRMFFADFDNVHKSMLSEARRRNQMQHEMLSTIRPSSHHLQTLIQRNADALGASLSGVINRSTKPIDATAQHIAEGADSCDALTNIVSQARQYTKVRMLFRARLLCKEAGKFALRSQQYPAGSLEILKSGDIFANPAEFILTL